MPKTIATLVLQGAKKIKELKRTTLRIEEQREFG